MYILFAFCRLKYIHVVTQVTQITWWILYRIPTVLLQPLLLYCSNICNGSNRGGCFAVIKNCQDTAELFSILYYRLTSRLIFVRLCMRRLSSCTFFWNPNAQRIIVTKNRCVAHEKSPGSLEITIPRDCRRPTIQLE